ncbi:LysR family transcriptional regulator [Sphingomonas rhizophila]|uniref:LysR family transcriptional regulator n=1 Tax=Sphingomonas rhizophila TaxID=2071607 RepID=A0A7G9SCI4_9SPHN|nr:LysR substrate-binding domain-containing protein [Sphingomonas rhizophila]QNN65559.1 LysR family transcriptional regulator [Sphingomonas rhizophila]
MTQSPRNLPPLSAIRAFEAAARLENFTAAAAELGMTQAAVSYQVKALEQRLGAPLFARERGRAVLTPLGARLLPALTGAFDAMAQAFAINREEDEGLLTIATTFTFANTWLTWRLGSFQIEHPDLAVRLSTGNALVNLVASEADVAIRAGTGDWPDLDVVELMPVDFTPMCTPSFLKRTEDRLGRPIQPGDLTSLSQLSPDDPWWDLWFDAAGVDHKERRRPVGLRLDSQADEGHAAMGGQGIALLTPEFWRNDMRDGRLVQPFPITATAGYRYWLVTAPGRSRVPKIKRFREWLLDRIADTRS